MQIHQLKRKTPLKEKTTVGRGGKRGKTSGRGTKGQKARAGHKIRPEIRDMIKRLPKLRGYAFNSIETKPVAINLAAIEKFFKDGEEATIATFAEKGLIEVRGGVMPAVKILGDGEITKKINVSGCKISASAKAKIEKAGGTVK